ncbi:hypothetical protein BDZ89DRAFT_290229 [Hymenopellis radicata]|nr:hypothetical protein BDZ89DRAFT_290229 [Hymenopellis radicata]
MDRAFHSSSYTSRDRDRDGDAPTRDPRRKPTSPIPPSSAPSNRPWSPAGSEDRRTSWGPPPTSASSMMPPPPPSSSAMSPPPPPPPPVAAPALDPVAPPPAAPPMQPLSGKSNSAQTVDAKRNEWRQRFSHFEDWLKLYDKCDKTMHAKHALERSMKIQTNPVLLSNMQKSLDELTQRLTKDNDDLHRTVHRIAKNDDWPTGPRPGADAVRNKHDDMLVTLDTLKSSITSLTQTVNQIRQEQCEENGMDVDAGSQEPFSKGWRPVGEARPLKRQRLESGEVQVSNSQMTEIREGFDGLEDNLTELHNAVTQHDREIKEEIVEILETRHAQIEAAKGDSEAKWRADTKARADKLHSDLITLSTDLAGLILESGNIKKDRESTNNEVHQLRDELAQLRERLDRVEANKASDEKELKTLNQALEAYMNNNAGPASASLLTPSVMQPYIETTVIPQIREALNVTLLDLHSKLASSITQREGEIYAMLWDKLRLTMSMVDTVAARLDKPSPPPKASSSTMPPPSSVPAYLQTKKH